MGERNLKHISIALQSGQFMWVSDSSTRHPNRNFGF